MAEVGRDVTVPLIEGSTGSASGVVATPAGLADRRTLEILERRRTSNPHRRGWLVRRLLALADVVGLVVAFAAVEIVFGAGWRSREAIGSADLLVLLVTLPGWIVIAKLYRLYDQDEERTHHPTSDDFSRVFHLVTVGGWLFFVGTKTLGFVHPKLSELVGFWAAAVALVTVARACARRICRRSFSYIQNTVIVGAGDVGQQVARKFLRHPEYGINVVGFVDAQPRPRQEGLEHVALLGPPEQLPELVESLDLERAIIAFSNDGSEQTLELARSLADAGLQVEIVPRLFDLISPNVQIDTVEGLPLVALPPPRISRSSFAIKRAIDIVGAAALLLAAAPFFAFIAWRVKRDSPGPVFFRQVRLGLYQREFTALKFRTMRVDADVDEHREYIRRTMDPRTAPSVNGMYKAGGDAITKSGRWLRTTSLDELPQLINVLKGEMSLVGPRPCIKYETEHFLPHHFDRFNVPAGITGLWQVTARAHATFREALDMDVAYARGWSLGLDLRLLCRTPIEAFARRATA
jgi:exopolysaccharide biosynthesis polyprenyl glycosylphosphotransferase